MSLLVPVKTAKLHGQGGYLCRAAGGLGRLPAQGECRPKETGRAKGLSTGDAGGLKLAARRGSL